MKQKSSFRLWNLEFEIWNLVKKQGKKSEGMSLLISMGVSFFILGMIMIILFAVSKSLERSANIARSNQVFFMAESGVEAAFYHHNARGAGLQFGRNDDGSVADSQKVDHSVVGGEVEWEIHARTTPVVGVLQENQTVQIPLFWDKAEDPSSIDQSGSATNFTLSFLNDVNDNDDFNELKKKYGDLDISTFDFTGDDEYLIDWKVMRKNSGLVETFTPTIGGVGSSVSERNQSAAIKESALPTTVESTSTTAINGRVTPCLKSSSQAADSYPIGCMIILSRFMSGDTGETITERQLIFRPLLAFANENGEKIPGIPYTVTAGATGTAIPKSTYDIVANVQLGNFHQKQELTVPETTSIGAFNYVIFD